MYICNTLIFTYTHTQAETKTHPPTHTHTYAKTRNRHEKKSTLQPVQKEEILRYIHTFVLDTDPSSYT
jgi:hypothetical protein